MSASETSASSPAAAAAAPVGGGVDEVPLRMEFAAEPRAAAQILLDTLRAVFADLDDAKFRLAAVLQHCQLPPKPQPPATATATATANASPASASSATPAPAPAAAVAEATAASPAPSPAASATGTATASAPGAIAAAAADPLASIPLAKHVVTLDEFDALNTRPLSVWQVRVLRK